MNIFKLRHTKEIADKGLVFLNGVIGDYLVEKNNQLAIPMQLVVDKKRLKLSPSNVKRKFPSPTNKLCVLVHGLSTSEKCWDFTSNKDVNYGKLLQKDFEYTPLYIRYNTGLHISENGEKLAALLDDFLSCYPIEVTEVALLGYSMGGLVSRSACYYANENKMTWVSKVKKMFFIGTPHLGAPLEKIGNALSNFLDAIPTIYTTILSDAINLRSAGIKDLRFGYLKKEDWSNHDPDAFMENNKDSIPLMKGVSYYVINGIYAEKPNNLLASFLGDILVLRDSALANAKEEDLNLDFKHENHKEFLNVSHLDLPRYDKVYEQIKKWIGNEKNILYTAEKQANLNTININNTKKKAIRKQTSNQLKSKKRNIPLGLLELIEIGIEESTLSIEKSHKKLARQKFLFLERFPVLSPSSNMVKTIQMKLIHNTYKNIRLGNRILVRKARNIIQQN